MSSDGASSSSMQHNYRESEVFNPNKNYSKLPNNNRGVFTTFNSTKLREYEEVMNVYTKMLEECSGDLDKQDGDIAHLMKKMKTSHARTQSFLKECEALHEQIKAKQREWEARFPSMSDVSNRTSSAETDQRLKSLKPLSGELGLERSSGRSSRRWNGLSDLGSEYSEAPLMRKRTPFFLCD